MVDQQCRAFGCAGSGAAALRHGLVGRGDVAGGACRWPCSGRPQASSPCQDGCAPSVPMMRMPRVFEPLQQARDVGLLARQCRRGRAPPGGLSKKDGDRSICASSAASQSGQRRFRRQNQRHEGAATESDEGRESAVDTASGVSARVAEVNGNLRQGYAGGRPRSASPAAGSGRRPPLPGEGAACEALTRRCAQTSPAAMARSPPAH